ncbi:conserved hypothetical protein [Rippkaea orientalis PCC 8801]|uniref:Polysaccharide pyruvyl transferase domain-containing protein n=1 Tax=Rippkaea orientalis (strain PCC 8801 / RF-1) TaxID=41431 RepID=B7K4C5_RIPO1|nr:polysaccharide pyruvyl transferase family protein [Rippkaea orientalis]ACK67831.1 conserved hypothetical protein [Rippkaea orientalis PCC 8801]
MISLHGAYFGDNFGDLLLLEIFKNWVTENNDCEVVLPMTGVVQKLPKENLRKHFPHIAMGLKSFQEWQSVVYFGGGYFGEPDWARGQKFKLHWWNRRFIKTHILPAELSIWKDIPYGIFGVEVGPISNILLRTELKRILNRAKFLSVRNVESKQYIENDLGINRDIVVAPDAALTINKEDIPYQSIEDIDQFLKPYRDNILLGIHAPGNFLGNTAQSQRMREGLITVLKSYSDVMPVVFSDNTLNRSVTCEELANLIKSTTGKECLSLPFQGIWETVALISRLSALLTTKLHVGIVAYALQVYCESFATHQKTPKFYRVIDCSERCKMVNEITSVDMVVEKINRAVKFANTVDPRLFMQWETVRNEALINRDLVHKLIEKVY